MPRLELMSWDKGRRRWLKEYKPRGSDRAKKYAVSCVQLSDFVGRPVPATKEGSYQVANEWWLAKKAEIDAASRPTPRPRLPMEDVAAALLGDPTAFDDQRKI